MDKTLMSAVCASLLLVTQPLLAQENPSKGLDSFAELYLVNDNDTQKGSSGILPLHLSSIRPDDNRQWPYPIEGHTLIVNPPVFTWPMADFKQADISESNKTEKAFDEYLRYDFQMGRTADFSDSSTFIRRGLHMPFYNHHQAFEEGTWYWRYRVSGKEWSPTFRIDISSATPRFESPLTAEAYQMIPASHPRIYGVDTSKEFTKDQRKLLDQFRAKADKALPRTVESYQVKGSPIPANALPTEITQIMRFRLRYEVEAIDRDIENLLYAYMETQAPKYMDKAITLANHIAGRDGVAMYNQADFSACKSMATLAMMYDVAYSHLNDTSRQQYAVFIKSVMQKLLNRLMLDNIGAADGILAAHFFQHTFYDAFTTTIIMKDHLPEASEWFNLFYNIWLSRSPGGGFLSDGVWPNGNMGYIHVNMESMVSNYVLYRKLFGINLFQHPWYLNCANALGYTVQTDGSGDGFSDGSEEWPVKNYLRAGFSYILGLEQDNANAIRYAYRFSGQPTNKPFRFAKSSFVSYRLWKNDITANLKEDRIQSQPHSVVFPQTGIAIMNSKEPGTEGNLFLSFRSSPFGVGSHGLAEQNSFNIMYGGKPLFYPTGYKITTRDKHYLLAHKHSRARNTLTVNGKTQSFSHNGYGWIARYLNGENITYVLGDASNAYTQFDESASNWIEALQDVHAYTAENGFILTDNDDPKVKTFRRHVALLRPNIVVVYDELESEKDVTWTFRLNGLERSHMRLNDKNDLIADADNCDALSQVFGSSSLNVALSDTSYIKPFDWLNPQRGRKPIQFEKNQYNSTFENTEKCKQMRFLAIIQIDESNQMAFVPATPDDFGQINIGNYTIHAEMDISHDARLEITNLQTGEYLLYGPTGSSEKANARQYTHSTILSDPIDGFQEAIDRYPLMVPDNPKRFE